VIGVDWTRQLHQAGTALAVTPGMLVVHERGTRLVGVDPDDGSTRWDVHVGTWPRALAVTGRRCLVMPQNADHLLCLDLETGERVWDCGLHPFTGHLVMDGDTILVGGWRGYTPLRVVDMATGRPRCETDGRVRTVRPVVAGAGFLVAEPDESTVRLLDRRDLREISSWSLPRPLVDSDDRAAFTAVTDHRLLARCGSRSVVEIVPSTGTVREFLSADRDLSSAAPAHVGGALWVHERRAGFTVADPVDGHVSYRVDVRQHLVDDVVRVDGGFVVAGTGGTLFHLDAGGQVIAQSTVSRRIRALRGLDPVRVLALTKGALLAARVA
jgi:outer membrane protein assembly factor BamB